MIISASRRTDIPAFFGGWFLDRLKEQFVEVPNPMNPKQVSKISLAPADVDCFVFWTKNPRNFFPCLEKIDESGYRYYFQYTLNPYEKEIEPDLPEKMESLDAFIELSERIGKEKIIWRYDPVIINKKYPLKFHEESFFKFCEKLKGRTEKCVLSFVDNYSFLKKGFSKFGIKEPSSGEITELAAVFAAIAKTCCLPLAACAEKMNLEEFGIVSNRCIDADLVNRLFGAAIRHKKDPAQRAECCCSVSRDIGSYNTCKYNCIYCYAKRARCL